MKVEYVDDHGYGPFGEPMTYKNMPKCPACHQWPTYNEPYCPFCGVPLEYDDYPVDNS